MSNESQVKHEIKLEKVLDLGSDFPPPSFENWKAAAEESLKGAPYEKKLVTPTYEGIDLQPIYNAKDIENLPHLNQKPGFGNFVRGTKASGYLGNPCEIAQEIPAATANQFNDILKNDIKKGLTSVNLILDQASALGQDSDTATADLTGNGGPAISNLEDLSAALADIDLEKTPIHITPGFSALTSLSLLKAYLEKTGQKINEVKGSIDADPLGFSVTKGKCPVSAETAFNHMAQTVTWTNANAPQLKTIGVSGLPYHNGGADAVKELAYVLATAVEYAQQLLQRDVPIDTICNSMRFTFGIGAFYFMEVAKIRAARMLWAKIAESFGANEDSRKMTIHARTSAYNQTAYDPYVNMLRTTTEAFSAIVAGVDSIHTNNFNEVYGNGDEFARRVARNTQLVLLEESRLDRVIDPAGGSYFVETLTHQVAEKAWKLFQEIEAKGGMLKALQDGFPQSEVESVEKKRKADIAKRKTTIIGTNFTANVKEKKLDCSQPDFQALHKERSQALKNFRENRNSDQKSILKEVLPKIENAYSIGKEDIIALMATAFTSSATIGEVSAAISNEQPFIINPIKCAWASESFEQLRDAVEDYKTKTGAAPKLFLATMGSLAQHKPRADFSQSFFEIGGFDVIYPQGFDTPTAAVEAAIASQAPAVVICSTDETYPELVAPITKGLKEKNSNITVVLAGYPKDQIDMHKQSGVDEFIYLGVDAYQVLSGILKKLGVLA